MRCRRCGRRDDKLRPEIAAILTAHGELATRHPVVFGRLASFRDTLEVDQLTDEQLQEPARQARQIVFDELADIYRRISVRGLTIHMLTTDKAITAPIQYLQAAVVAQQKAYMDAVAAPAIRQLDLRSLGQ
jgi:L-rhamnose isomerase